jgi:hypothetical protein
VNEAYASRIPVKPPELGISTNRGLAEFLKRGSAEHYEEEEKNAVPTPYRFDFTQAGVSRLKNGNEEVQSVTNFLN